MMEYTAIFEKMDNGWYFAQCEQMPNAVTQGKTIAEAKENLQEVITSQSLLWYETFHFIKIS